MKFRPTELTDVVEIVPQRHRDNRGWLSETWSARTFEVGGRAIEWVQDNESTSIAAGTLRGLHYQARPMAQDKLVRVSHGRAVDVAVDLRRSSPTFGRSVARELSAEVGNQMFIPQGFGHGFLTLTDNCVVSYKVSDFYSPELDRSLAWNDPDLAIEWPIDPGRVVLSDKDASAPFLAGNPDLFD